MCTDYTADEFEKGITLSKEICKEINRDRKLIQLAAHLIVTLDRNRHSVEELANKVADSLRENLDEMKWTLVGDPAEVTRRLESHASLAVDYCVLNFAVKTRDRERIELFAREIIPGF